MPARPARAPYRSRLAVLALTALLWLLAAGCGWAQDARVSNIKPDEYLVFFRTDAWFDAGTSRWHLPIHGWVYELEHSWFRKNLFAKLLEYRYGLYADADSSELFGTRTGLLIADNERNKRVVVRLGERLHTLPPSGANGHFRGEIVVAERRVEQWSSAGGLEFTAVLPAPDPRQFIGRTRLLPDDGHSVISDIDDTIKVTGVGETRALLEATFFEPFEPVPGMAGLYRQWFAQGLDFHFVSSSPWQLYGDLRSFIDDTGFPPATLYLKSIRFKDSSFFALFKSGLETKPVQIETLLERYPQRSFTLIGDSGEEDPEAYTLMYERYPERIERILIRNVTDASLTDLRFTALLDRLPANKLLLFRSPMELDDLPLAGNDP